MNSPIEDFVAADLEFHRKIALGAGNSVLASLVDNMSVPTRRARLWRGVTEPRAQERTLAEHAAIYHAIMSRDADLARSSAIVHIAGIDPGSAPPSPTNQSDGWTEGTRGGAGKDQIRFARTALASPSPPR